MTRIKNGIESQFWNIQEPEPQEFKLNIKFVKRFPSKIHKHAEHLICWAFKADTSNSTAILVGFPANEGGGEIEALINNCYAIVNEYGIAEKLLVHNYNRAFKLNLRESASSYAWMIQILKYGGRHYFDSDSLKDLIANCAIEQGVIKP